jgi:hypothetical protein
MNESEFRTVFEQLPWQCASRWAVPKSGWYGVPLSTADERLVTRLRELTSHSAFGAVVLLDRHPTGRDISLRTQTGIRRI